VRTMPVIQHMTKRSPVSSLRVFARDRRGEMDEAAIVFPVLLLLSIGLVNMALLGVAAVNAGNAANYGARMGAVAQSNPAGIAYASASQAVHAVPVGVYGISVSGGGAPGSAITVSVNYTVPNYFASIAAFFGGGMPERFTGSAVSHFRQEGW
jgi:Flp pilus assembly protein TadG